MHLQGSGDEELALWDWQNNAIALQDTVSEIFPNHGPGSACSSASVTSCDSSLFVVDGQVGPFYCLERQQKFTQMFGQDRFNSLWLKWLGKNNQDKFDLVIKAWRTLTKSHGYNGRHANEKEKSPSYLVAG